MPSGGGPPCGRRWAPTFLPVLAHACLTHQSSGRFLFQEKCWHLHDYLVDTLGPYVINVTRVATACSQHGATAMGAVPGETQDCWKPFCTCSQVATLEPGRPSAAPATEAGKTPPAGSLHLNLDLKKQYKARNHLL